MPAMMRLRPALERAHAEEDGEAAKGITRCFVEMAESYIDIICGSEEIGQLEVVQVSQSTFHFFYIFL